VTAVLISPFMPGTSEKIMAQIGIADVASQDYGSIRRWGGLPSGVALTRADSLFPRVKYQREEASPDAGAEGIQPIKAEIAYEDFDKIDLRVATVIEAEAVPKSDKLLKLKIDIGEKRTIVAGIGKDYKPADLVGKKIVIVANLKPAKLMGVESRGMLLAADATDGLTLLSFDRGPKTGSRIR
jgi:methionyl-tRNA synthetase